MELRKAFPAYFSCFTMPDDAAEQELTVYRACRTRKIEKESFLNTYEENGFQVPFGKQADDPQVYSMSTYEKLKDIKRFVCIDSRYVPPLLLAKGITDPKCGISCRTAKWRKGAKGSHVDWWLYEGAEPWKCFREVNYDEELSASQRT